MTTTEGEDCVVKSNEDSIVGGGLGRVGGGVGL